MPLPDPTHLVSVGHIAPGPKRPRGLLTLSLRLWTINRWLRWSGWRLTVITGEVDAPTRVGVMFYGWGFVGHEPAAGRFPSTPVGDELPWCSRRPR